MNIQLISRPNSRCRCKSRESYCLQTRQMQEERARNNENAGVSFHQSDRGENYQQVTLPEKVSAFFLSRCGGHRLIPLTQNARLFIVDDKDGFPPGLAECAIELRKRNIWVVQSRSRANRQAIASIYPMRGWQYPTRVDRPYRLKKHCNVAKNILPNTRDERQETFKNNASSSSLCALLATHPEQIQRYVSEGFFYSGQLTCEGSGSSVLVERELVTQTESVCCAFCEDQFFYNLRKVEELRGLQRNSFDGWQAAEAYLNSKKMHDHYSCRYMELPKADALLEVRDQAGRIRPTEYYFMVDPVLESTGSVDEFQKSCTYTRVFVMADISEQERRQLVIPHDQINEVIHQQQLDDLCTRSHQSVAPLTTALQSFEHNFRELSSSYQQIYEGSELNRAVTSYRCKLQSLPRPTTRLQQEILDFLEGADAPLRTLYASSKRLTHLLPLTCNAGLLPVLTPEISKLVAQYQQAMQAVHGQINITDLTTLVPYELWNNSTLREIGEVGNEVLDYLNRLNIDDNELYQAFMAYQLNNSSSQGRH